MKTDGIRRLVSALGKNPYQEAQNTQAIQQKQQQASEASRVSGDAVKVSFSFSGSSQASTQQSEKTDNADKVKRIKEEVSKGTYAVSSEKVATALVTELGF